MHELRSSEVESVGLNSVWVWPCEQLRRVGDGADERVKAKAEIGAVWTVECFARFFLGRSGFRRLFERQKKFQAVVGKAA
ncbi:hypothetical protein SLE2022_031500 [Rubroshorea leprosula]